MAGIWLLAPLFQQIEIDKALAPLKTDLCIGPFSPPQGFLHEINLLGYPLSNLTCGKCSFKQEEKKIELKTTWMLPGI